MNKLCLFLILAVFSLFSPIANAWDDDCPRGGICESTQTGGWIDGSTFSDFSAGAWGDEAFAFGESDTRAHVRQDLNAPAEGELHGHTEVGFGSFSSDQDGDGSNVFGEGWTRAQGRIETDGGMGNSSMMHLNTQTNGLYHAGANGDETIAWGEGSLESSAWQGIGESGSGSLHADFSAGSAAFSSDNNGDGALALGFSGTEFQGNIDMGSDTQTPRND